MLVGILDVRLQGYFLATNIQSLRVLVSGAPCVNVVVTSAAAGARGAPSLNTLQCTITSLPQAVLRSLTVEDVRIQSLAGDTAGIDPFPLEAVVGRTNRPVLVAADLTPIPCRPYAVAIPVPDVREGHSTEDVSLCSGAFLYWSNVGLSALHRSWTGSTVGALDTVLEKV